ncbi:MAG: hypothetical protein DRN15_06705 [Thermoprotei archaeon]|nr:MAG: hypothetical protein DRN15_06705 [Thermoprotei archaeon]
MSWRLGRSLGVDPVQPPKICTYDCIYCQLGPTRYKIGSLDEAYRLRTFPSAEQLRKELERKLRTCALGFINFITFSGCGEPTLSPNLRELVLRVRDVTKGLVPVAILTNSSLICDERVASTLAMFDLVIAKLDAPSEEEFKVVNRPHEAIRYDDVVEALKEFRRRYRGVLAVEIMLLKYKGLNLIEKVDEYKELIRYIGFDMVQANTVTRPPQIEEVKAISKEEMNEFARVLREELRIDVKDPYSSRPLIRGKLTLEDVENEIYEVLKRRPCSVAYLSRILGLEEKATVEVVRRLLRRGLVEEVVYRGEMVYRAISSS